MDEIFERLIPSSDLADYRVCIGKLREVVQVAMPDDQAAPYVSVRKGDNPNGSTDLLPGGMVFKRGFESEWTFTYCLGSKIFKCRNMIPDFGADGEIGLMTVGGRPIGCPGDSGAIVFNTHFQPGGLVTGDILTKDGKVSISTVLPLDDVLEQLDVDLFPDSNDRVLSDKDLGALADICSDYKGERQRLKALCKRKEQNRKRSRVALATAQITTAQ